MVWCQWRSQNSALKIWIKPYSCVKVIVVYRHIMIVLIITAYWQCMWESTHMLHTHKFIPCMSLSHTCMYRARTKKSTLYSSSMLSISFSCWAFWPIAKLRVYNCVNSSHRKNVHQNKQYGDRPTLLYNRKTAKLHSKHVSNMLQVRMVGDNDRNFKIFVFSALKSD